MLLIMVMAAQFRHKEYIGWIVAAVTLWYHINTVVLIQPERQPSLKVQIKNINQVERIMAEPKVKLNSVSMKACEPATKIVFLKTHKTGSESISGILRRYAILHNVSTLLSPSIRGNHLFHKGVNNFDPVNEHVDMAGYGERGAHYEMIANHMTWNGSFVDQTISPRNERFTFSILRSPTTQLESAWKFFYPFILAKTKVFHRYTNDKAQAQQLYRLLNDPLTFYSKALKLPKNQRFHILRNQLASFGIGDDIYKLNIPKATVNGWIAQIEKDFDLIMILEYFDYSLALLAIELCWPLEELANIRVNEGKKVKIEKPHYIDDLIRVWNYPDYMLYEHFNTTLWRKIDHVGLEKVESTVQKIKKLSEEIEKECVDGYRSIKLTNKKQAKEAILKKPTLKCNATILWGKRQSKLLLSRQEELMKAENWSV